MTCRVYLPSPADNELSAGLFLSLKSHAFLDKDMKQCYYILSFWTLVSARKLQRRIQMNSGSSGWLEAFAAKVAGFVSRQVGSESSATRRIVIAYTTVIRRLLFIVSVFAVLWLVAVVVKLTLATNLITLVLAAFTFALLIVVWPVGSLVLRARYKELVGRVLVAELGAGVLVYIFHVEARAVPPLFLASSYLAASSAIGPARGTRRSVNGIAMALIVLMLVAPYFPKSRAALTNLLPKVDNGIAAVLNGNIPKIESGVSVTKVGQVYTATITLPADGSPSPVFDPNTQVPLGWYYRIDNATTGTRVIFANGATAPYKELANYPVQSFTLERVGGGQAIITWQPAPFTNAGQ